MWDTGVAFALLRFLMTIIFLGAFGYAGMWALVTFVTPEQRPMKVVIPPEKYSQ
jgi:hypothetical protein